FLKCGSDRQTCSLGALGRHWVKGVRQRDDSYCSRHLVPMEPIGVARAVGALVMPAHDLGNLRPWELHVADDLVTDGSVVPHRARFFVIERRSLGEEVRIDGNLTNIV